MLTSIGWQHSVCGVKSPGAEVHGSSRRLFRDFTFMFAIYFLYSVLLCVLPHACQAFLMDRPLPASGFSWCLCHPGSGVAVLLHPLTVRTKQNALLCTSLDFLESLHINAKMTKTCLRFIFFFIEGGKDFGIWILSWSNWLIWSPQILASLAVKYTALFEHILFVLDVVFWNLVSIFLKHRLYTWFVWYCQFCTGWKYSTYLVKNKVFNTCTLTFWNPGSGILHLGIHRLNSLGYL